MCDPSSVSLRVVGDIDVDFAPIPPEVDVPKPIKILLVCEEEGEAPGKSKYKVENHVTNPAECARFDYFRCLTIDERDPVISEHFIRCDDSSLRVKVRIPREASQLVPTSSTEYLGEQQKSKICWNEQRGVKIEPSPRPDKIVLNLSTGSITATNSSTQEDRDLIIPRSIIRRASSRKLIPGTNISLLANGNGKYVRADPNESCLGLYADRNMPLRHEVFAVIKVPFHEDAVALMALSNLRYVCSRENYGSVRPDSDQPSYHSCFFEESAGNGQIVIRAAFNDQYVGSGPTLKLLDRVHDWEKFTVVPKLDMIC